MTSHGIMFIQIKKINLKKKSLSEDLTKYEKPPNPFTYSVILTS